VQVAAAGRGRLLLAVVLVLLGLTVAPGSGVGSAASNQATCESAATAPPMHGDRHDPLRLSATAPQAFTAALPNTWWAVCQPVTYGCAPTGRSALGETGHTGNSAAAPKRQSSRAPPPACAV